MNSGWECQNNRGAVVEAGSGSDSTTEGGDDGIGDGEAEAGALRTGFAAVETIEDVGEIFFGDTDTGVFDDYFDLMI